MKTRFLVILAIVGTLLLPVQSFAQTTECLFGNADTPVSDKLAKDFAVKAFVEKHPDSSKSIATENGMPINQLVLYSENSKYKETLKIRFSMDSNGCYIPTIYDYSYDDGIIAPVVRNYSSNFTEVVTLIKADAKTIQDFYPENCQFVDVDVSLTSGKHYGACKSSSSNRITVLVDSDSSGTAEMDIPITLLYSLSSTDCKPTGDFSVMSGGEEVKYEISPTSKGNLVKVEYAEGFHQIDVLGSIMLPSPSPAQYCGIVEGYVDKQYLAPLDQVDHGMRPESVKCNNTLVLIQKYDGSPACVTESTKQKLIERGWANTESDIRILKFSPVLFKGTGIDLQEDELVNYIKEKRKNMDVAFEELGGKGLYPITGESFSIGQNAYSLDEQYVGKPIALDIHVLKEEFTKETLEEVNELVRKYVGDEIDMVYSKGGYAVPTPLIGEN